MRSFGTENRPTAKFVPPRDEVYEYIIFRANDIKDLIVDDPVANASALADPAIIQAVCVVFCYVRMLYISTFHLRIHLFIVIFPFISKDTSL